MNKPDPYWGKGGRYQKIDGQRVPVVPHPAPRMEEPATPDVAIATPDVAPAKPARKGK